jgi:hypothetical protein
MSQDQGKSLSTMAQQILQDGVIDANEVARLRARIYADRRIDRSEADVLFQLNDATSGRGNHPSWGELFVEAIGDFVLKDEASPGVVSEEEASYLISHIRGDGRVDANELALLVKVVTDSDSCPPALNDFVLEQLKAAVVQDGRIDAAEVQMISKVVYGKGGGDGSRVSREEADFLCSLNQATRSAANHPSWQALFVAALSSHLLEDPNSPGAIDEAEGQWLLRWIDAEQPLGEASRALLSNLRTQAKSVPGALKARLG